MDRVRRLGVLALVGLGVTAGGCTSGDDGADVETSGWSVNGVDATGSNCDLFEVGEVLLELEDLFDGFVYEASFDCSEGTRSLVVGDFLPPGDYEVRWSAYDDFTGDQVDIVRFDRAVSVVSYGERVIVDEARLSRPRVEITWDTSGLSCAQAGIDTVELDLVPVAGGTRVGPFQVDCSDAGYLFDNVDPGDYDLEIDGYDAGFRVYAANCEGLEVPPRNGSYLCERIQKI